MTLLLLFQNPAGASASPISSVRTSGPTRPAGSAQVFQAPRTTGPYVAAQYSSFQGDGGNDGSAITTGPTLPGDQLLVIVTDSQSNTPPTPPTGWREVPVSDTDQGTNFETHYYLLDNPAASTTYTWTVVGGRRTITGVLVRNGVYESGDTLETVTSTSHLSPTVTSIGSERLAVAVLTNRAFPTCAWTENQAGSWDERIQTVGGDGVTNMQVSVQNKPVGTGAVSDTFLCANGEPAIIGVFLFGAGPATRGAAVIPAQPLPKLAGTATITGSRTDPPVGQQDFPPRTIVTLGTTRAQSGTSLVLPAFDGENVAPPRQAVVTAVRPPQQAGSAQVLAPHTDITPDTLCPAPILSTGRPGPVPPGGVVVTGPRTDPTAVVTNACPQPTVAAGRPPAVAGSSIVAGSRTDPTPDTPTPQPTVAAGRPGPLTGSTVLVGPRTDVTPDAPIPVPDVIIGRVPTQSAGSSTLTAPRVDPTATPDAPCPPPVVAARPVPAWPGTAVLVYVHTDVTPDTLPPVVDQSTAIRIPVAAGQALITRPIAQEAPQPRPGIVVARGGSQPAGGSATLQSTFTAPVVGGDSVRAPLIVTAGRRLIAAGAALFGRFTHSCTTPRPTTGATARPSTGTTAYNLTATARPSTGTTARPNTGTTQDPC